MILSSLIKKGGLRVAAAIPATAATDNGENTGTVASLATIALANPQGVETLEHDEARHMAGVETAGPSYTALTPEQAAEIDAGNVQAVLIHSSILDADLWIAFDDSFSPGDGIPVFYSHELQFLKDKPAVTLRKIFETKRAFGPGCRVRQ
jgi:hypothetical protein